MNKEQLVTLEAKRQELRKILVQYPVKVGIVNNSWLAVLSNNPRDISESELGEKLRRVAEPFTLMFMNLFD
jgi:hypothetical protein